jgi:hypothetical protein
LWSFTRVDTLASRISLCTVLVTTYVATTTTIATNHNHHHLHHPETPEVERSPHEHFIFSVLQKGVCERQSLWASPNNQADAPREHEASMVPRAEVKDACDVLLKLLQRQVPDAQKTALARHLTERLEARVARFCEWARRAFIITTPSHHSPPLPPLPLYPSEPVAAADVSSL